MTSITNCRAGEKGNVLFLILIAVALFAALSYAVTQSTRSGGGSTEKETNLLNSASLTQYPTSLRTAVVRMILNGADLDDIGFDPPSGFSGNSTAFLVFHPDGGGAVFQQAPSDAMSSNSSGAWYYNGNFEVGEIGQSGAGGNDLIAFLPGIGQSICKKLNEELGVTVTGSPTYTGIPDFNATTDADITDSHLAAESFPTTDRQDITGTGNAFTGKAAGCFYDSTMAAGSQFVFYAVVLER